MFEKKTWVDRVSEFINRRTLRKSDDSLEVVTVSRNEGTVTTAGDAFNATTMNAMEDRINDGFDSIPEYKRLNLLEITATSQTINGVTFTVNDDKSVSVSGTATANAIFVMGMVSTDNAKYQLHGCVGGNASTYRLDVAGTNGITNFDGTTVGEMSAMNNRQARIIVFQGITVNTVFYPMLEKVENLLPITAISKDTNGITYTVSNNGTITATGTASASAFIKVGDISCKSGTYNLNGCPAGGSVDTYYMYIASGNCTDYGQGASYTPSTDSIREVYIVVRQGTVISTPLVFTPRIDVSPIVASPYVPYNEIALGSTINKLKADDTKNLADIAELQENVSDNTSDISNIVSQTNKNLLEKSIPSHTQYGVTLTNLGDGGYLLSGTCSGSYNFETETFHLNNGKYILSANNPSVVGSAEICTVVSATTGYIQLMNSMGVKASASGDLKEADDYKFRIHIQNGVTYNYLIYPMLEEIPNLCTLPYNCHYQTGGSDNNVGVTCEKTITDIPKSARTGSFTMSCYLKRYSDETSTNVCMTMFLFYTDGTKDIISSTRNEVPTDSAEHYITLVGNNAEGKTVSKLFVAFRNYTTENNAHFEVRAPRIETGDTTSGVYTPSEYIPYGTDSLGATIDNLQENIDTNTTDISNIISQADKNLLEITATSQTVSGVTFTINDDKSVSASGTATDTIYFLLCKKNLEVNKYLIHGCPSGGNSSSGYSILIERATTDSASGAGACYDTGNGSIFSLESDRLNVRTYILIRNGVTVNTVFYPMLEKVENLLPVTIATQTKSGVTLTNNGNGTLTLNGTASENIYFNNIGTCGLDAGTYVLSGCPSTGGASTYKLYDSKWGFGSDTGSGATKTFATPTVAVGTIFITSGAVCDNVVFTPRIDKSPIVPSPYVPHGVNSLGTIIQYLTDKVQSLQQSIISLGGNV